MSDGLPHITAEVSFTTNPADTPVWVDLDTGHTGPVVTSFETARGRSYERDQPQAGSLSVTLDNSSGDFTPDRTSGRYYPNVETDKAIRISATPPAPYDTTTYRLHQGDITDWLPDLATAGFDDAQTTVKALDGLDALGVTTLLSAYDHEQLRSSPVAYYPLSDMEGSTVAGDLTGQNAGAVLTYRGKVGGNSTFGGAALLTADPGTSLELSPENEPYLGGIATYGGHELFLPATTFLQVTGGFTVEVEAAANAALLPTGPFLFDQWSVDGKSQVFLSVSGTSVLAQALYADGTSATFAQYTTTAVTDGQPHHYGVKLGTDKRTVTLYFDGLPVATGTASSDLNWTATQGFIVGGNDHSNGGGFSTFFGGRLGKFAVYNTPLSDATIATHYAAGSGFTGEKAGARIGRILDYAGWPASRRALDAGLSVTGPLMSTSSDALSLIQAIAATEQGVVFVAGNGNLTFFDRSRTLNTVSRVTLGTADLPVEDDLRFQKDNRRVKNVIVATRPNGPTIRLTDEASRAKHRDRVYTVTYEVSSDYDLRTATQWDLLLYSQPRMRSEIVSLDPLTAPALWPWALGLEIGDRITISNLPAYAPASSIDYIVQAISHRVSANPTRWTTTLQLSPPIAFQTLRVADTPNAFTKLDAGLKLAY